MDKHETELICIVCPKGCHLLVSQEGEEVWVSGFHCPRGQEYGKKELTNPTRVLTSIVKIAGGSNPCCPVKTDSPIPKKDIEAAMQRLRTVCLTAPVRTGDVVAEAVDGGSSRWVVTKDIDK